MNRTCIAISLTAALLTVIGASALAQGQPQGISVSGTAGVKVKPDIAYVSFGVTNQDTDASKAAQANAATTNHVIDAIFKRGISKSDIETINYSVSPMYNYPPNAAPVITGYTVSNVVRVKLRDIAKVGALIDTGIKAGANNVQGVTFTIDDDAKYRAQALAQAMRNAQVKAQAIAEAAGVKLGRVYYVSESGGYGPRPMLDYGMAKAEAAPTPIMPGEVEVSSSVTVTYSIL